MLYAFVTGTTAIVVAADTKAEFDAVDVESLSVMLPQGTKIRRATIVDYRERAAYLQGLPGAILIDYDDPADWYESSIKYDLQPHGIAVQGRVKVIAKQESMAKEEFTSLFDDTRTLAEIFNLTESDPWDARSEEEKVAAAEREAKMKEQYDRNKEAGNLSGESFDPKGGKAADDTARIWEMKTSEQEDGSIKIDSALAVKGLWGPAPTPTDVVPNSYRIDTKLYTTLFRVDFVGVSLADVEQAFENNGTAIDKIAVGRGEILAEDLPAGKPGAWIAAGIERLAKKAGDILMDFNPDIDIEIYGVNLEGERLVPKGVVGVKLMDTNDKREIGPRPWDARPRAALYHAEIALMSKDDRRKKWVKDVRGDEFIYTGSYDPMTGSTIYVVPTSYWMRHQKFYPHKLNIEHLLPSDFVEETPGLYRSKSRDWNQTTTMMNQINIEESMMIRLYLNTLP